MLISRKSSNCYTPFEPRPLIVAIPPWLTTNTDIEQSFSCRQKSISPEGSGEQRVGISDDSDADIPIFCAGGCGEVVGYFSEGQKLPDPKAGNSQCWCPACKAANASNKGVAEVAFTSADELDELRKPTPDRAGLGLIQVAIVAIIMAGSVCIAMGRAIGIYLAVFGTLAWFVVCFVLRKLRE
jgi:hypothetical protein